MAHGFTDVQGPDLSLVPWSKVPQHILELFVGSLGGTRSESGTRDIWHRARVVGRSGTATVVRHVGILSGFRNVRGSMWCVVNRTDSTTSNGAPGRLSLDVSHGGRMRRTSRHDRVGIRDLKLSDRGVEDLALVEEIGVFELQRFDLSLLLILFLLHRVYGFDEGDLFALGLLDQGAEKVIVGSELRSLADLDSRRCGGTAKGAIGT